MYLASIAYWQYRELLAVLGYSKSYWYYNYNYVHVLMILPRASLELAPASSRGSDPAVNCYLGNKGSV